MEHILISQALCAGVKIGTPSIVDDFYPISFPQYITVHNTCKFESRRYEYFDECIEMLRSAFSKHDIGIVQIGTKDEPQINGVDLDLRGKTTINQMAFIIKNAICHIGVDSFPMHLAGFYNIPCVGLYPNMLSSQSRPYWGDSKRQILLEPDRKGLKPSYSAHENPKTINSIMPEKIANSVLKLFNSKSEIPVKTLHIGEFYKKNLIEIIPSDNNYSPTFKLPKEAVYSIRLDKNPGNYKGAIKEILFHDCKAAIFVKGNPVFFLDELGVKEKVDVIVFEVDDTTTEECLSLYKSVSNRFQAVTKDELKLKELQFKFFEYEITFSTEDFKKNRELAKKIIDSTENKENLKFVSSATVFYEGVKFSSYWHFKNGDVSNVFTENCAEKLEHLLIFENLKNVKR